MLMTFKGTSQNAPIAKRFWHRRVRCHNFSIGSGHFMKLRKLFERWFRACLLLRSVQTLRTPERLHQRVLRILALPPGNISRPAIRWKRMAVVAIMTVLAFLFIPAVVQNVRANAFVEAAAETHRSYLEGNLPMEIHSASPAAVTAWFAGKVPFDFQLPDSQQPVNGHQIYQLTGSRLVNFKDAYAALTTYEMQEQRISLLVVSDKSARAEGGEEVHSGSLTFHDHTVDGFKVITWSNRGLTYALVSSLPGSAQQSCLVCHQNMPDHLKFPHP